MKKILAILLIALLMGCNSGAGLATSGETTADATTETASATKDGPSSGGGAASPTQPAANPTTTNPAQPTAMGDQHRPFYVDPAYVFYEATSPTMYKYMQISMYSLLPSFNPSAIWDSRYTGIWATFDPNWPGALVGWPKLIAGATPASTFSTQYLLSDATMITITEGQDLQLPVPESDDKFYSEFVTAQFDEAEFPDGPVTIRFTKTSKLIPVQGIWAACEIVNDIVTGLRPDTYGVMDKAVKWTATYVLIDIGPNK